MLRLSIAALLLTCVIVEGGIDVATFANTAFAGSNETARLADLSALTAPAFSSVRVIGTLAPAQTDLLLLWVAPLGGANTIAGWLLLWLDDHLLLDTAQRGLSAVSNYSFVAGNKLPVLRIDWLNNAATACSLALSWRGNNTAAGAIPASALLPDVPPEEASVAALRARIAAPPWVWGTYAAATFWTHVRMPSALAIACTLVVPSSGKALGAVQVFPNANPAVVRILAHGYDGSTFTESSVSSWHGADCTTTLSSTVDVGGALRLLATSNGTACTDLALLVTFNFEWRRAGVISLLSNSTEHAVATAPGFDAVHIYASAKSVPVVNAPSPPFFALALVDGGAVGVSTGVPVSPAAMATAISAARAAHDAQRARFPGDLADAYDAQQTVIAANTIFTPYESGLVTPVTRSWQRGGTGYVLFPWDNLFLAWMASFEPASKDISYSNLLAVLQSRTQMGALPGYHAGTHDIADRSECQLGAQLTLEVYKRFNEVWLVQKLFGTLLGWAEWVWTQRMGAGSAQGPLIVLGSDFVFGDDEHTTPNLYAAGLESGIDNGVAFVGLDAAHDWDNTTFRIKQYDVGASAFFVAECEALIELAAVVNRSDVVPLLRARGAAVAAAMDATMWNADEGVYESTFYNLTWHKRRMPTAFYPMLSGLLPAARVQDMLPLITSPLGFCVNDTAFGDGDEDSSFLVTFFSPALNDNMMCLSDACIGDAINSRYKFVRQEGLAQREGHSATVPLFQWVNAASGSHALTANATPPAPGYTLVRQEGFCFADAAPGMIPITLWHSAAREEFQTCAGNPACYADVHRGFDLVGTLCFGFNATTAEQMPCKFGMPSASRSDDAFFQQNYWRGRLWGPEVALSWLGLRRYDAIPEARSARKVLVKQSLALELQNWRLSRQVLENVNSICGSGEDGGGWGADPFYHWGALFGYVALLEAEMGGGALASPSS